MTSFTDKHIIDSYLQMIEGLSNNSKKILINKLTKSIEKNNDKVKDSKFEKLYGAWKSDKSADEIIADIKSSRSFRQKDLNF